MPAKKRKHTKRPTVATPASQPEPSLTQRIRGALAHIDDIWADIGSAVQSERERLGAQRAK